MNRIADLKSDSLAPLNPSDRLDEVLGLPRFDWQPLNPIQPLEPRAEYHPGPALDPLRLIVWGGYAVAMYAGIKSLVYLLDP